MGALGTRIIEGDEKECDYYGRNEETRRNLKKKYIRIYSHVLACNPSLIRVNFLNLISLAFAKVSYFPTIQTT